MRQHIKQQANENQHYTTIHGAFNMNTNQYAMFYIRLQQKDTTTVPYFISI